MTLKKYIFIFLVIIFPMRALSSECPSLKERKELRMISIGVMVNTENLDPINCWNYQQFLMVQAVFETLVKIDEKGNIVSGAAGKWDIDSTGTKYTFYLNPKSLFHNGNALTSQDVTFSIARHFWPHSKSMVHGYLLQILKGSEGLKIGEIPSGLKILDERTILFELEKPYPPFLSILTMPGFSIVPQNWDQGKKVIGSGPMMAEFLPKESEWKFTKFDKYSDIPPKTNAFCIKTLTSSEAAFEKFENGSIDIAVGLPSIALDPMKIPKSVKIVATESLAINHLFLNSSQPLFKTLEYRKLLGGVFQSIAQKKEMMSPYERFEPYYIPLGVMPRKYYERDSNGELPSNCKMLREKTKNNPLKIALRSSRFNSQFFTALEESLRKCEISYKLDLISDQGFMPRWESGDFDIISYSYMGNFPDPDGFLEPLRHTTKLGASVVPSKDLILQLNAVRHISDPKVRLNEYAEILKKFESEWYVIPLYRLNLPILYREHIHIPDTNFRYEANLRHIFWQVE